MSVARGPRVGTTTVGTPPPGVLDPRDEAPRRTARAVGGRVLASDGTPAAAAWLLLEELGRWAVTAADGRFSLRGLPDGRHAVQVRGVDGSTASGEIAVPGPPLSSSSPPPDVRRRLNGRCRFANGCPSAR